MSKVEEVLEKVDMDTVKISIGLAVDLFKAGNEILDLIKEGNDMDEIELIELIAKHDKAKDKARESLIESIKKRKEKALS
jgi:hypothetical protein